MSPFVEIKNLTKIFQPNLPPALDKIQANFSLGQMIGLVGPDGAGKTTLIRLIAGLLLPTEGEILVGGFNTVNEAQKIQEMLGMMPQRFGLYEDLTVMENLQLYADLRAVAKDQLEKIFEKLLTFTDLSSFTTRLARDLSGGMKQKLGLACALLKKPKLLLLDEPSVGVDPVSRRELWNMVSSLLDPEICILWSTAYLNEAEKCDLVLLLNDGKLQFFGKPQELTDGMKGKVFRIEEAGDKRKVLRKIIELDGVVDGVIEGKDLRLILDHPIDGYHCVETAPRFEDAFVELLKKGIKGKETNLEQRYENQIEFPVVAKNLTKRFADFTAVNDLSFEVKRGEIFGLLGPNGAGKSTTFKMLCGLLSPSGGSALINGTTSMDARAKIGYMAQKFSLYGNLTVAQNLDFFGSVYCPSSRAKNEAVEKICQIFSLQNYLSSICDTLPIGFKQRLSFAAAILHAPDVLFLDEPTSGMDPITRRAFWRQVSQLALNGCTIMVTTHFMDEAENCDRIALVYQGKIIHLGDSDSLKNVAKTKLNPNPTLDDAFIYLIEKNHDRA